MIYDCVGAPHPQDVETCLDSILKMIGLPLI